MGSATTGASPSDADGIDAALTRLLLASAAAALAASSAAAMVAAEA